jgi:hypothetical protein
MLVRIVEVLVVAVLLFYDTQMLIQLFWRRCNRHNTVDGSNTVATITAGSGNVSWA